MINPDEHFLKGSSGHEITSQAVAEIDRARKAGLAVDADRLESNLKASIITLQRSGGKDTNGFNTIIKSISSLAPQINSVIQEGEKLKDTAKAVDNALALSAEVGNTVAPETLARLDLAKRSGDIEAIKSISSYIDATNKSAQERNAKIAEEKGKAEIASKEPPKKTAGDVSFEQNSSASLRYADELINAINKYGTTEIYNSKGSAKLAQLPYQMAIAYAKTVDPTSVAREGEVDAAKKYLIPMGMFTRKETALAAANEFKKDIEARVKQYNLSTGVTGVDTVGANDSTQRLIRLTPQRPSTQPQPPASDPNNATAPFQFTQLPE
jgi:hypothetical protein